MVLLIQSESILISLCSCHKCDIECEVSLSHGKRGLPISWEVFLSHRKRSLPISWEERSPYLMGHGHNWQKENAKVRKENLGNWLCHVYLFTSRRGHSMFHQLERVTNQVLLIPTSSK